MRYLLGLSLFTLSLFGFDYHLKPYTIANGVECFFGLSTEVNEINGGNVVNSCYVVTDEGYIVIDSGPTYSYAQQAYQIMYEGAPLPVKYVINTTSDEVHVLGNGFYKERGAKLLGPSSYARHYENNHTTLQTRITPKTFANTRVTPLDTHINKDTPLTLGTTKLNILKADQKSDHYLMVHLPEKSIIFVGDMVFNNRIPPLKDNRSLLNWLQALKNIEQTSWKRIISGHGIKTKYSALKNTTSYLKALKEEVEGCLKQQLKKETCIENVEMYAYIEDNLYDKWHSKNVAVTYDELSKRQQTVTLKPVLPKSEPKPESKQVTSPKPKKETEQKEPIKKVTAAPKKTPQPSKVQTYSYLNALNIARSQKKIVLLKIRSDNCPYCDELDAIIRTNSKIKTLINKNYIVVSKNISRESLPEGIHVRLTPSLAFIRPDTKELLMITPGIEALGELVDILEEAKRDGLQGGYLQ